MTTLRGRVVLADDEIGDAVVVLAGDRVVEVRLPRAGDPDPVGTLLPGLVDVHCHGGGGHALATTDPDEARAAAAFHLARGTTTLVASLVTDEVTTMAAQARVLAGLVPDGVVAGIHLEGPFLSAQRCGAHPAHLLLGPEPATATLLLTAGGGHVRHVTLAPELPGADAVADLVRDAGAVVAVGHSDADAAAASAAFRAGARSATHLFNAMRPWRHRGSSVVSAALAAAGRGDAVVELVADGTHVDAGTVAAVFDLVPDRVALVSDAAPPAGLPDGDHVLGRVTLQVRGGVARTPDGTIAGGSGSLLDVVRFTHREAGVALPLAVAAATRVPATLLGLDRALGVGRLAPGARADLLVVGEHLQPLQVWRAGQLVG
jgi:N-acetylglucosamine-6-phosphate deacetylase